MSIDCGPNLVSHETTTWLRKWKVNIRTSSPYYHQSNGRAEAGVKSLKHLLKGNTGPKGSIKSDQVAHALLQYRNTPLRGINNSPAELALGRCLRDGVPFPHSRYKVNPDWNKLLETRESQMSATNETIKKGMLPKPKN